MDRLLELTSRAEATHFWFRGFRSFVRPMVEAAAKTVAAPRLLDCGCGTGANLGWLDSIARAYGFDLTWQGLAIARGRGRSRVARASIGAIPFPSQSFDVVTSFDVFQCLPDETERAAIREMHRVVRPGGHLVMSVAALEILRGGHAVLSEEVRRYSRGRLRRLVEDAGFRVERLTFANASLVPLMLPVRLYQRWTANGALQAGEFDITVPPAPLNAILSTVLGLEAAVSRVIDMPIGSSLLCHARRTA
jgi:SAM-dependent methyltransferase